LKYGPSTSCSVNGQGGVWASNVYRIGILENKTHSDVGIFQSLQQGAEGLLETLLFDKTETGVV